MSIPIRHLYLMRQDGTCEVARVAFMGKGRPQAVSKNGRVYVLERLHPEDESLMALYHEVDVTEVEPEG